MLALIDNGLNALLVGLLVYAILMWCRYGLLVPIPKTSVAMALCFLAMVPIEYFLHKPHWYLLLNVGGAVFWGLGAQMDFKKQKDSAKC